MALPAPGVAESEAMILQHVIAVYRQWWRWDKASWRVQAIKKEQRRFKIWKAHYQLPLFQLKCAVFTGFEVQVSWDVMQWWLVNSYTCFKVVPCLHHRGQAVQEECVWGVDSWHSITSQKMLLIIMAVKTSEHVIGLCLHVKWSLLLYELKVLSYGMTMGVTRVCSRDPSWDKYHCYVETWLLQAFPNLLRNVWFVAATTVISKQEQSAQLDIRTILAVTFLKINTSHSAHI
jgi:hypothetical protein